MTVPTAREALDRLIEGNKRFVSYLKTGAVSPHAKRLADPQAGQEPIAVILGCSDSRVPAEIVFDQGLGDLFVIRVAGNVVASSQVGSVEFAAEALGTRLVVVLGHSHCGAVKATLNELEHPSDSRLTKLDSIVSRIRPAVAPLLEMGHGGSPEALMRSAIRANIRASANQLRYGSVVLERHRQKGGLRVVGAEYSLDTGNVDFFDGVENVV